MRKYGFFSVHSHISNRAAVCPPYYRLALVADLYDTPHSNTRSSNHTLYARLLRIKHVLTSNCYSGACSVKYSYSCVTGKRSRYRSMSPISWRADQYLGT